MICVLETITNRSVSILNALTDACFLPSALSNSGQVTGEVMTSPAPGPLSSVPTTSGSIPGLDLLNSGSKADPSNDAEGSGEVSNMPAGDCEDGDKPEQVFVFAPWEELYHVGIFLVEMFFASGQRFRVTFHFMSMAMESLNGDTSTCGLQGSLY